MSKNHSNKNLRKASFAGMELSNALFAGSDLRGADFSGANLNGAYLTQVRTGIPPVTVFFIFLVSLFLSLLSGYVAMLAGQTMQEMLHSTDANIKRAGIATIIIVISYILFFYWKGGKNAFVNLVIPIMILSALIGVIIYMSGLGTGKGMLYLILALALIGIMFTVGTIARAAAGTLSNILFVLVALSGGFFGRTVGGGIGTVVLAVSCMQISKRALSGAKGFDFLLNMAFFITSKFGTSFRKANLNQADFSGANIHNSDFTDAALSGINWNNSKKTNCIIDQKLVSEKKRQGQGRKH